MNDSKMLLIDQYSSPLKLVESHETPSGPHTGAVLATLFGTLSDFGHATRNGRRYTGSLWKKVLNDELFKEAIEYKNLLGESDHPLDAENRLETHIPYVSHIIRDVSINEAKQVVEGYIDVLDTPHGRIIKTLLDYGSTLGVSSRGSGDLITINGETLVDENCYNFITWDIVARPSNKEARVYPVGNTKRSALESLNTQINEMIKNKDKSSLRITESLIINSDIPNKDLIINKIKESLEVDDPDHKLNQDDDNLVPKSDLDDAYKRVLELKSENDSLKSETEVLKKSLEESENTISDLNDFNKNLSSMVTSYMEELQSVNTSHQTMMNSEKDTDEDTHKNEGIITHEVNIDESKIIEPLSDMVSIMLTESNKQLSKKFNEVLSRMDQYIDKEDYKNKVNDLSESLRQANSKINELQKVIKESKDENTKLSRRISSTTNEYFKLRCSQLGLNEQVAKNEFNNRLYEYDLKDIDEVLNELYLKSSKTSNSSRLIESTDSSFNNQRLGSLQLTGSVKTNKGTSMNNIDDNDDEEYSDLAESIRQVRHA